MALLEYRDSDEIIKIHHFSSGKSSWSTEVLLEPLMEKLKVVYVEFENLDVINDNIFGNFGRSRIERKKHRTNGSVLRYHRDFPKKGEIAIQWILRGLRTCRIVYRLCTFVEENLSQKNKLQPKHRVWHIEVCSLIPCQIGYLFSACFHDIGLKVHNSFK